MQKITPHLWFDSQAGEAAEFYTSVFEGSRILNRTVLHDTPTGDAESVSFELSGFRFMAISGGPQFTFNPSISFHARCTTIEETDRVWRSLSDGGKVMMELGTYPFSKRYGWVQDRYGLSWQVIHTETPFTQRFMPALLFAGKRVGMAEEAVKYYISVFGDSRIDMISRYGKGMEPDDEQSVQYAAFTIEGMEFAAMDSAREHDAVFNEAVSFMVTCDTQPEIDSYWQKLSADPSAEQCGWLKDRFGVSWQITPAVMGRMMSEGTPEQIDRVTRAFLPMKKLDIDTLERAYRGA